MSICETPLTRAAWNVQLQMLDEPRSPEKIVHQLSSIDGPVDVYFWFEGSQCLPQSGAIFMKEQFFEPLYQLKPNAKLCLYSLKAWSFEKTITTMPSSTSLGEAINRINTAAVECIYSSLFFQYCRQAAKIEGFYAFINDELPKKAWLFQLSNAQRKCGTTVGAFFDGQSSLFDCIKEMDLSSAYSLMQYVEGYYLIRESVRKGLEKRQQKIEIAFALPNDESKYYRDLPQDIEQMLQLDFGKDLANIEINIRFQVFQYGESLASRPYIDKQRKAAKVKPKEISFYFNYLS